MRKVKFVFFLKDAILPMQTHTFSVSSMGHSYMPTRITIIVFLFFISQDPLPDSISSPKINNINR